MAPRGKQRTSKFFASPTASSPTVANTTAAEANTETPPKIENDRKRGVSNAVPETAVETKEADAAKRSKMPSILQMLKAAPTPISSAPDPKSTAPEPKPTELAPEPKPTESASKPKPAETKMKRKAEAPNAKLKVVPPEPKETDAAPEQRETEMVPEAKPVDKRRKKGGKEAPETHTTELPSEATTTTMGAEPNPVEKKRKTKGEPVSEPKQAETPSAPKSSEPSPQPKLADATGKPAQSSENAQTCELKLGGVSYTCLCTCDPAAAASWAELVTRDVNAKDQSGSAVDLIGMDCEWAPPWHRAPGAPDRVATVQLFHHGSNGRRALVFRVAGLGELPTAVMALLGEAKLAKVGVAIAGDASRLVRDFGCPVRGLYDLRCLDRKPQQKMQKSMSLEDLVRAHCPEDMHIEKADAALEKGVRTGNWESWPLSAEQIHYAAQDAALGVMTFTHKFGIENSEHQLTKAAVEALADLEEVSRESEAKSEAKIKSAVARKGSRSKSDVEVDPSTPAAEGAPTEKKENKHNFFQAMRNSIVKAPNIGKKDHPKGSKDALAGVCIIVSAVLDSFERADMEQYVKDHGGSVSKTVIAKVTHLVTDHGEAGPSKLEKCKKLGIPIVSEDVILKLVSDSLAQKS